jgi:hypothetical protein
MRAASFAKSLEAYYNEVPGFTVISLRHVVQELRADKNRERSKFDWLISNHDGANQTASVMQAHKEGPFTRSHVN